MVAIQCGAGAAGYGRPPNWRWLRAVRLAQDGRRRPSRQDDDRVREAVRFVRCLRRCADECALAALAARQLGLAGAHALYAGPASWTRWELEARLLTEESFDRIAARMGADPEVVAAYHDLFFDVRGRLHATDWVANHVLGRKAHTDLAEDDTDLLLKIYALRGGPLALEGLIDYLREPPDPAARPERLDADARAALRGKLQVRAAILARVLPAHEPSSLRKLEVLRRALRKLAFAEAEARTAGILVDLLKRAACPAVSRPMPQQSDEIGTNVA